MTCIIGSKAGWMVADRRVTFDGWIGPYKVEKIHRAPGILIGVSGTGAVLARVRAAVEGAIHPVDIETAIRQLVGLMQGIEGKGSPSELLVVAKDRLVQIDPSGGVYELSQPLWAIGCGSMSALSWLRGYAYAHPIEAICPGLASHAIHHVSTLHTSVGDGGQTEWLEPPDP